MVSNIKVLKDNSKNIEVKEENIKMFPLKIKCSECDSELEIAEEDTHIGWMGARFITCPCCGEEAMIDELDGITLTKDNLEFPHFAMEMLWKDFEIWFVAWCISFTDLFQKS